MFFCTTKKTSLPFVRSRCGWFELMLGSSIFSWRSSSSAMEIGKWKKQQVNSLLTHLFSCFGLHGLQRYMLMYAFPEQSLRHPVVVRWFTVNLASWYCDVAYILLILLSTKIFCMYDKWLFLLAIWMVATSSLDISYYESCSNQYPWPLMQHTYCSHWLLSHLLESGHV